jgi:hypothetical protein
LTGSQPEVTRTLNVLQSQQFHFVLSASDWNNPVESGVEMSIVDASGREAFNLIAADGSTRNRDVFLNVGQYTVRFSSTARPSDVRVTFQLSGITTSEPLGPQLRDTTLAPVEVPVDVALSALTFYWLPAGPPARLTDSIAQSMFVVPPAPNSGDSLSIAVSTPSLLALPTKGNLDLAIATSDLGRAPIVARPVIFCRTVMSPALDLRISENDAAASHLATPLASEHRTEVTDTSLQSFIWPHQLLPYSQKLASSMSEMPSQPDPRRRADEISASEKTNQEHLSAARSTETAGNAETADLQLTTTVESKIDDWLFGVGVLVLGCVIWPVSRNRIFPKLRRVGKYWRRYWPYVKQKFVFEQAEK